MTNRNNKKLTLKDCFNIGWKAFWNNGDEVCPNEEWTYEQQAEYTRGWGGAYQKSYSQAVARERRLQTKESGYKVMEAETAPSIEASTT